MMPNLRERVRIDLQSQTVDASGNVSTVWWPIATVSAQVSRKTAKQRWIAGRDEGLRTFEIVMRWRADVGTNHRIYWRGRRFDITGALNLDGQRQWLTIYADERDADADGGATGLSLLSSPQVFNAAPWSVARATIAAGAAAAPDGSLSGYQLVEDATLNSHPLFRTVTGLVNGQAYVAQFYIKANGRSQVRIALANSAFAASPFVTFDLAAVTTTAFNNAIASILPAGNGWFRCLIMAVAGASGSGDIYIQPSVSGSSTYTGDGASGLFIANC